MSGMSVYNVVSTVHSMINCFGLPDAVLIHCGGNDIGFVNCRNLLFDIRFMLYIVSQMINSSKVIFSSILPRLSWRHAKNSKTIRAMDVTRKRINRGVKSFLKINGGYTIVHQDFEDKHPSLFDTDKVHLSFIGNDIFLNSLQSAIEQFIFTPHELVYPKNI